MAGKQILKPGQDCTGVATADVLGGRLVKISATRAAGENFHVAHAGAGEVVFGYAGHDFLSGKIGHVIRGGVVMCRAGANITAGQKVKVAANGTVIPWTGATVTVDGNAQASVAVTTADSVGVACADITSGADGPVALNLS